VISIVGHSGSGKTTLIEQLIPALTRHGLRVATLKNAHHNVQLDTPGKDSWRYTQAGAARSLLVTQSGVQMVDTKVEDRSPQALAQQFMAGMDVVLAEGFSHAPGPKIEVLRRACATTPRCSVEEGVVALVTDVAEAHPQLPHLALDDIEGVAAFILKQAGR
jgi:molybdopterin-guanine dinucleotide biosynthesis protein B